MSPQSSATKASVQSDTVNSPTSSQSTSWLHTPKPIRRLFAQFPLATLPSNSLPSRTLPPPARKDHTLFLFSNASSTHDANAHYVPSFNPTCLKHQTYLLSRGIRFRVAPSSNHASPSGSLPFIIPAQGSRSTSSSSAPAAIGKASHGKHPATSTPRALDANASEQIQPPISASGLQNWADGLSQPPSQNTSASTSTSTSRSLRETAYLALITTRLRPAWLHTLYLTPNLHTLAAPLYIHPTTSSSPVRTYETARLRAAAAAEVRKAHPRLDGERIYEGAAAALDALETLLGGDEWFFGAEEIGELDCAVLGYLGLLLDSGLGRDVGGRWSGDSEAGRLRGLVKGCPKLVRHTEHVRERYFKQR